MANDTARVTNRQKLIISCACVALSAALTILLIPTNEPRYGGRTLTTWLLEAESSGDKPAEFKAARKAVLAIGTNALPCLLEWSRYPEPTLRSRLRGLLEQVRHRPIVGRLIPASFTRDRASERFRLAPVAFAILGPLAAPAAPELSRKLRAAPDWFTATVCLAELQATGPQSIPLLCEVITNPARMGWTIAPDPAVTATGGDMSPRVSAIQYLISMGTNAAAAFPAFVQATADEDPSVAVHAVLALGLTGAGNPITVTALTNALQDRRPIIRASAVDALLVLGAEALPAIPALLTELSDEDAKVRESATNTLRRIAPGALTSVRLR